MEDPNNRDPLVHTDRTVLTCAGESRIHFGESQRVRRAQETRTGAWLFSRPLAASLASLTAMESDASAPAPPRCRNLRKLRVVQFPESLQVCTQRKLLRRSCIFAGNPEFLMRQPAIRRTGCPQTVPKVQVLS